MPQNDGAIKDEDSGEGDNVDISNLPVSHLTAGRCWWKCWNTSRMQEEERDKAHTMEWFIPSSAYLPRNSV